MSIYAEIIKTGSYSARMKQAVVACLLLFVGNLVAQIPNRGYDTTVLKGDSSFFSLQAAPIIQTPIEENTPFYLRYTVPTQKINQYYNPKVIMPRNSLFLDYRGSSYYVPRMVNNRIAQIMNRPSPDSFLPVFAVAAIAAKLALEYVHIEKKIRINPSDYNLPTDLHPLLISLWEKTPQTAFDIFKNDQIRSERTLITLEKQLDILVAKKLVKIKTQEKAPAQYFIAQPINEVKELIRDYLAQNTLPDSQRLNLQKLLLSLDKL